MTAGHFEAKKHAIRQTQDGWIVSFVVHPNDISPEFAIAPLGTRYMVGFAQIGDDEQPLPAQVAEDAARPLTGLSSGGSSPPAGHLERSLRGKARYAEASDMERAVTRAALLAREPRFWQWIGADNEVTAAEYMRTMIGISSRSEIGKRRYAYNAFMKIETDYLLATDQLAEPR